MKHRNAYLSLLSLGVALLATGCGRPGPDAVVAQCVRDVEVHQYDKALAYCGDSLRESYSNHIWLSYYHRQLVDKTAFTIEPAEMTSPSSAWVRMEVTFRLKDKSSMQYRLRVDVNERTRWYMDDVWRLRDDGSVACNAIRNLPVSVY
jgi:hypothetical protein